MTDRPLVDFCVTSSTTLLEAASAIERGRHRTVIVIDRYDTLKVLGILSEGDVMRALIRGTDVHTPIHDFMRVDFRYLQNDDRKAALMLFAEHGFTLVPVVDKEMRLRSVITLLQCLREHFPA